MSMSKGYICDGCAVTDYSGTYYQMGDMKLCELYYLLWVCGRERGSAIYANNTAVLEQRLRETADVLFRYAAANAPRP